MGARLKAFTPRYRRGFEQMMNSEALRAVVHGVGMEIAAAARSSHAVGPGDGGHIRDHYKVRTRSNVRLPSDQTRSGHKAPSRVVTTVYNDHAAAIPDEVGYVAKSGRWVNGAGTLARAAGAAKGP